MKTLTADEQMLEILRLVETIDPTKLSEEGWEQIAQLRVELQKIKEMKNHG